ncbi:transmembrane protein 270 [Octodon degus]|uniref:Transmembrane protein 270 n=1 Tax=Octodon degus TaxID=10160 RepID=A0A6P6ECP1_OCTDE|nr:transmembrane protein 270 [Octodon degus]
MEAVAGGRASLSEVLLQGARLWALLVQNRLHLYRLLLLKIAVFRGWVVGLSQEAWGPSYAPTHQLPGDTVCALSQRALRIGLVLLLCGPRLVGVAGLGLCVAAWRGLLRSCLHSLTLVALLSLLLAWRLFRKAQCFLGCLYRQALVGSHMVLKLLALPRCLCWHLAYSITWTTCLASHLLQAAFEHTTKLAQAQGPSGSLSSCLLPALPSAFEGRVLFSGSFKPAAGSRRTSQGRLFQPVCVGSGRAANPDLLMSSQLPPITASFAHDPLCRGPEDCLE